MPAVFQVQFTGSRLRDPLRHIANVLSCARVVTSGSDATTARKNTLVCPGCLFAPGGRPNGVGFALNIWFQLFDVTRILAYALSFVAVMLVIENFLVQPLERHANRWRPRAA